MARVPVPEDYDAGVVPLPSDMDYDEFEDAVTGHAGRRAIVREDEDGRYVGVHEGLVDDVADYLGVERPSTMGSDVVEVSATIEAGECPWCDDYDGEHVGQHASSAHPDEWAAYTEGSE